MATAISSLINNVTSTPKNIIHTCLSPSSNLPFKHLTKLHLHTRHGNPRITTRHGNPRITTRQAKLNGGVAGMDYGELDGAFFGRDDVIEDESGDDDDDDDDDTESSIDLFFRFVQSMFKKVSKRAKKASRSILPSALSPQLVSFAVDGVLILASLSILKAFLEVVCNIGGLVFVVILLLRMIWATISYFQSNGYDFKQGGSSFGTTQPAA